MQVKDARADANYSATVLAMNLFGPSPFADLRHLAPFSATRSASYGNRSLCKDWTDSIRGFFAYRTVTVHPMSVASTYYIVRTEPI